LANRKTISQLKQGSVATSNQTGALAGRSSPRI